MSDKGEILTQLMDTIGEEGCGVSCSEAEVFEDDQGWYMRLEGFMSPWYLGRTVQEAKMRIKEYAAMGFGLH